MKKSVFILISLFSCVSLFSQEKGHYLSISGNLGSTNLSLNKSSIFNNEIGYGAKLGYSFFFSRNFGIGSGVGMNIYNSNTKYNSKYPYASFQNLTDDLGTPFTKNVYLKNWEENQKTYFLEIPLLIQFQHKFANKYFGIYANLGAKAQIPVKSNYSIEEGDMNVTGKYDLWGGVELEQTGHGYYLDKNYRPEGENNLKFGIAATASAGFNYGLNRNFDIFGGAYIDYGIIDIHKDANKKELFKIDNNQNPVYQGTISNQKINPFSFGGEIGLRYKFGKSNLESRKECKDRKCAEKALELEAENIAKQEAEEKAAKAQQITVKVEPIRDPELNNNLKRIGDLLEKALSVQGAKAEKVVGANNKEAVKMEFDADVLFQTGKSALSQKSKESLVKVVQMLQENPDASVDVFGHTDNVGSLEYNQRLSVNRAQAVAEYLINMGVKRSQIHRTVGKNYSEPISDNQTPEGRSKNRRVDILMYLER